MKSSQTSNTFTFRDRFVSIDVFLQKRYFFSGVLIQIQVITMGTKKHDVMFICLAVLVMLEFIFCLFINALAGIGGSSLGIIQ